MLLQLPSDTATIVTSTNANQPGDSEESSAFGGLGDLKGILQPK